MCVCIWSLREGILLRIYNFYSYSHKKREEAFNKIREEKVYVTHQKMCNISTWYIFIFYELYFKVKCVNMKLFFARFYFGLYGISSWESEREKFISLQDMKLKWIESYANFPPTLSKSFLSFKVSVIYGMLCMRITFRFIVIARGASAEMSK